MNYARERKHSIGKCVPLLTCFIFGLIANAYASESDPRPTKVSMEEAVQEGLDFNLDLAAAKYNVPLSKADELTAGLWNNPSLTVDTATQPFGKNWDGSNNGGPKAYDLTLSYPFDFSGKHSTATKSAVAATQITEATLQDTIRQKILQIRLGYIDVMTLQHQLRLSREKESDLSRLVNTIEDRIGHKSLLPLLQVRAQLARTQAALDTKQKQIALRSAKTTLEILLGRAPNEGIETSTDLRDFKLKALPSKQEMVDLALENRPDLQAQKITTQKSVYDRESARAQIWDDFVITAGISKTAEFDSNDPDNPALPGAYSWSAGITIPFPVFNRNQGNIKKAMLSEAQSEKQVGALELSIEQEIGDIYNGLESGRELIQDYESKQLKAARQVRDSQQKLFGTGSHALLDYFDAIGAYVDTLSSYYDTVGDYRRSVAKLCASVGKDVFE